MFTLKRIGTFTALGAFSTLGAAGVSWTCSKKERSHDHLIAQNLLLKTNIKNTQYELKTVKLPTGEHINTFFTMYDPSKKNLVMLHGWGSGLALWASNIDDLAKHYNVYCIDLLGFGRSDRPKFSGKSPEDAKSFWVDSIEAWRKEMGLSKFLLLGHSLGGFLVTAYAIEHPDYVDKLILAAPVGIAPWRNEVEENFKSKALQHLLFGIYQRSNHIGPYNITPQSLLRAMGPWGHKFWTYIGEKSKYRELDPMGWDYLYHNQVGKKSGDLAFIRFFSLRGWEYPLFDKLKMVKAPLRIIYGENDYIRPTFGPTVVKHLLPHPVDYTVINGIGHHMYWKRKEFAQMIIGFDDKFQ
jgi:pimeloyl-ACP methyl ester carboxylesterase